MSPITRLIRLMLGAGLALAAVMSTAGAQYYYQPAPRHYPAPQYLPQPYHGPGAYYYYEDELRPRRRGPAVHPRAVHPGPHYQPYSPAPRSYGHYGGVGSVCVTSRGNCSVGQLVPLGSGCRCNIPGFGRKRGQVDF
jgi:hypothetical protein